MSSTLRLEDDGNSGSIYDGDQLIADCYYFGDGPSPWRAFRPGGDNPDTASPIAVAGSLRGLFEEIAHGDERREREAKVFDRIEAAIKDPANAAVTVRGHEGDALCLVELDRRQGEVRLADQWGRGVRASIRDVTLRRHGLVAVRNGRLP